MQALNKRIKTLSIKDIAMIELGGISLGIVLARLLPSLTDIGFHQYLLAYIMFAVRPLGKLLKSVDNENNEVNETDQKIIKMILSFNYQWLKCH